MSSVLAFVVIASMPWFGSPTTTAGAGSLERREYLAMAMLICVASRC